MLSKALDRFRVNAIVAGELVDLSFPFALAFKGTVLAETSGNADHAVVRNYQWGVSFIWAVLRISVVSLAVHYDTTIILERGKQHGQVE